MARHVTALVVAVAILAVGWWAWLRPRPSDEELIYQLIVDAAQAVEAKDAGGLLRLVSQDYHDSQGNTRQTLTAEAIGGFRSPEPYTLVPRVSGLTISGETAQTQVKARLIFGRGPQAPAVDLDVRLTLAKEGRRWRVTSAEGWESAVDAYMNEP